MTVLIDGQPVFSTTLDDRTYAPDTAIDDWQLPAASGGNEPLTYSLSDSGGFLPAGLSFSAAIRTLSGTPSTAGRSTLIYSVADAQNDTASLSFDIYIDSMPSLGDAQAMQATWALGTPQSLSLPSASGGNSPLTYSLVDSDSSGRFPAGLVFDSSTLTLSGTPTEADSWNLIYRVQDDDGDFVTLSLTLKLDGIPSFGDASVQDLEWSIDEAQTGIVLPQATGGNVQPGGGLVYSLVDSSNAWGSLPAGLSFDATTRTLSGTPTQVGGSDLTYAVQDDDGDSASLEFALYIDSKPAFDRTMPNLIWTLDSAQTTYLPTAVGGNPPLTTSLGDADGNLPAGLSFDANTLLLSGQLSAVGTTELTYSVSDADGDSAELSFELLGYQPPTFDSSQSAWALTLNRPVSLHLPPASRGKPPFSYSLDGILPTGVHLNDSSHNLIGTPSATGSWSLDWMATDQLGNSAALTITLRVHRVLNFDADVQPLPELLYVLNQSIDPQVLPAAADGNVAPGSALSYGLADSLGNLPPGLAFDGDHRTLSGTPTQIGSWQLTYSASDDGNTTVSLPQAVRVVAELPATVRRLKARRAGAAALVTWEVPHNSLNQPQSITAYQVQRQTDDGTYESLDRAGQQTTEHAHAALAFDNRYTWRVRAVIAPDAGPWAYSRQVGNPPRFTPNTVPAQRYAVAQNIDSLQLPVATSSSPPISYSLTAASTTGDTDLPTGLSFDDSTRSLSGTPEEATEVSLLYVATDNLQDSNSLSFTLTIGTLPSFGNAEIDNHVWPLNEALPSLQLPAATGGNRQGGNTLTYSLTDANATGGALPAGVSFDASARTLSGTPREALSTTLTYRAEDVDGHAATLSFAVLVDDVPSFGSATVANLTWAIGTVHSAGPLPVATGGNGTLTYSLQRADGALPDGLSFDPDSRTLSGTPTTPANSQITYSATDMDGDLASLSFNLLLDGEPSFGAEMVAAQIWPRDEAIVPLQLPAATGGNEPMTYSLGDSQGNLPAGLSFDAGNRSLTGTPTVESNGLLTYSATDSNGDSINLDFAAKVDGIPGFGGQSVAHQNWVQDSAITPLQLPSATGGNLASGSALAYSLSDNPDSIHLPAGLVWDSGSLILSGTPTQAVETVLVWSVSDDDADTGSLQFRIRIDGAPTFADAGIDDRTYAQGQPMAAWYLPTASGGNGALVYSLQQDGLDSALPAGLVFDAASRSLSGTPEVATRVLLSYQVADEDGDLASLTFTLKVDGAPTFGYSTIAAQSWQRGQQIEALTLPAATGGNGTLGYSLTDSSSALGSSALGSLPAGLSFDANSRVLSGTPTAAVSATLVYSAEDEDGDSASLSFAVMVDGAPLLAAALPAQTWALNETIVWVMPAATGGNGVLSYSLSDTDGVSGLPTGLSFDANTRTLSGTPTVSGSTELLYAVTDEDGDSDSQSFAVMIDSAPHFGGGSIAAQKWRHNSAIAPLSLPAATGGNGAITYSLGDSSGDLPDGLSFDANTQTVTGTPTVVAQTALTYSATDADGDSASLTFTVKIDGMPDFGDQTIAAQVWPLNLAIAALQLPEAADGNGTITYSLGDGNGDLPDGLSFDAANRTLTGTPSLAGSTVVAYTASDEDDDSASLIFTIEVDGTPDFGAQTIAAQVWTLNQAIAALQLPEAADGNGTTTYSLGDSSGNLPDGLSFDASTRSITGTPTVAAQTDLIYTATDADGDSASLTFTVKVDGTPDFGDQTIAAQVWTLNLAIAALQLPQAADGNGTISYSLGDSSGNLPDGLSFDASTRSITGTPTVVAPADLIYTATDADGDYASLTFTVKIDGTPDFGAQTIAAQVWTLNQAIAALLLPEAANGNGTISYSLGDS